MVLWNLGSVADEVHNRVTVPTSVSGVSLLVIADQRRYFMEKFLKTSVGSVAIAEEYQGPLTELTISKVLRAVASQNNSSSSSSIGTSSDIKLGDFSVKAGDNTSTKAVLESATGYYDNAMADLKEIKDGLSTQGKYGFFKALG